MFVDIPKDMLTGGMQGADVRLQNADPSDTDCWGQEATGPAGELVIRVSTNLTGCNTNSSVITITSSISMSKCCFLLFIYRVSHKKRNGGFSVACDLKVPDLFTSSNQATPAEENDTKIIKFH